VEFLEDVMRFGWRLVPSRIKVRLVSATAVVVVVVSLGAMYDVGPARPALSAGSRWATAQAVGAAEAAGRRAAVRIERVTRSILEDVKPPASPPSG
jgi:hypothetical protein